MKWEKCKRCGSNRVVKRYSLKIAIFLLFFFLLTLVISSFQDSFLAKLVPIVVLWIISILMRPYSRILYCKDCELKWNP
ncbi:hypothetical protein BACCIP111883_01638 [Sutcliffiella rhizosphaerae]|uniref:Uncharacterized protein n=1 Tax=Sutcliffiella rhizosphaerae TaxID=2880967 RepID=A0ABM8YLW3_9BACI|nr:hypothetical protein BACCIP111883_01638 [Sutcliffiella rhizosphaerae]